MHEWFARWARKEKMIDEILTQAAKEVVAGQVEADLGGGLFKKRIARAGQGKRGGYRTLIGYCGKNTNRIIFLHRFAKNEKANISSKEAVALQIAAQSFFTTTDKQVIQLLQSEGFKEVVLDEQDT
ncbi:type II toxin-antitoxin system RelE/ParE family toxin [Oceanidesulfovibrio marinus]|nr:type II toxin-antitoxin system RelE/ParE family toxin [Oceanidesulfovibrio marinus]